jgi:hypothetical protein
MPRADNVACHLHMPIIYNVWEPWPPGALRFCPGLCRDCFYPQNKVSMNLCRTRESGVQADLTLRYYFHRQVIYGIEDNYRAINKIRSGLYLRLAYRRVVFLFDMSAINGMTNFRICREIKHWGGTGNCTEGIDPCGLKERQLIPQV